MFSHARFDEIFVKERRYSKGVSHRTEEWYWQSWHAFQDTLSAVSLESLSKPDFRPCIERMFQRGVSPITINAYARAINAFFHWLFEEGHCPKLTVSKNSIGS